MYDYSPDSVTYHPACYDACERTRHCLDICQIQRRLKLKYFLQFNNTNRVIVSTTFSSSFFFLMLQKTFSAVCIDHLIGRPGNQVKLFVRWLSTMQTKQRCHSATRKGQYCLASLRLARAPALHCSATEGACNAQSSS